MTYRLPDGSTPVLLSSETAELLRAEAAAVLAYVMSHPAVSPQAIAQMLFRTRAARKHRALAMVDGRDDLLAALRAVADGRDHPSVVSTHGSAPRRLAYVFPGQGSQRPGMGRLFYAMVPAFRAEADRCALAFAEQSGQSPLPYLLDDRLTTESDAGTVQPALFTQMAGLAAAWRSFGVTPHVTVGHSQGEIAAAYASGLITLADAVRIIGIRALAAREIESGDYSMAVAATDRDSCEDLLARCTGWAELSVVNSPTMTGISGDRDTVQDIVDALSERGVFARVIGVRYPAHTSLISGLGEAVRTASQHQLENPRFLDSEIHCLGSTLGAAITPDLPVDQYWFWNLRNTVRFDKAIAAAAELGVNTFVELAEHPTLQLAIQENLAACSGERDQPQVVGTSVRTATDLGEFTRNLALLAVHDLNYSWDHLRVDSNGPAAPLLADFPNTLMNETTLWLPYDEVLPRRKSATSPSDPAAPEVAAASPSTQPRLLAEQWVRLSRRSLSRPRSIGLIDHTGDCAELVDAVCTAAAEMGATARLIDSENTTAQADLDTHVILLPASPRLDTADAADRVAAFFAERKWWHGVHDGVTDCWLVTVAGEAVVDGDAPPDLVHAAASAGFRSVGAKYPGVRFRHIDLAAGSSAATAGPLLTALHTAGESELALRDDGLYAKRVVAGDGRVDGSPAPRPGHVLIVGGTGKLGLEFCGHFAQQGAQRITLVSRSGETAAVTERLRQIRSAAATHIDVTKCDLSDPASVSRLAEQYRGAPADVIIHGAVEYSGVELEDITADKVHSALSAKVVGIARILGDFPRTDDCRVVLCSSVSATVGGRGLALYAAGNRMLDALAHQLRAEGLDCVSVQWGHWKVHLDDSGLAMLAGLGVVPMAPADALRVGMTRLATNAAVAAFDLDRARSVLATCGRDSLLSQLSEPESQPAPQARAVAPVAVETPARASHRLLSLLAEAIGVDNADAIDTTVPMVVIGLDSLQALEFRRRVQKEFDHELDVADLLGGASIADVLAKLDA
nr:nocobactin polyketide synthase NbtC [Mycobacterium vicinigordonae]